VPPLALRSARRCLRSFGLRRCGGLNVRGRYLFLVRPVPGGRATRLERVAIAFLLTGVFALAAAFFLGGAFVRAAGFFFAGALLLADRLLLAGVFLDGAVRFLPEPFGRRALA